MVHGPAEPYVAKQNPAGWAGGVSLQATRLLLLNRLLVLPLAPRGQRSGWTVTHRPLRGTSPRLQVGSRSMVTH
ncbi:hypothetical protein MAXJ12_33609 [Mesorhizobium alhagi CCNWXJ12-2]|uniref:Uncharacterized protein n=1 Tax=Mesorhizobium alhagi CCNWXJ12-2 TaxID=1107882 RepID=H0I2L6_9HYPH|nr:hypothetical protein MAXJ12_33609 [Mesorhizobium alhagi CCNWXJ12-2]